MSEYVCRVKQLPHDIASKLPALDLELTERCNNDCVHCCISRPPGDKAAQAREMSTDQVKEVLRQAADLGCVQVRLTGGEPLLRRDFRDIYLYARRLGMKVLIFTNACLVDESLAELFSQVPPLLPVEVSVYGMSRESYETFTRNDGSFRRLKRGLELLANHKVPYVVKGVFLPPNHSEIDQFEAWSARIPAMQGPPRYVLFPQLRSRRDDESRNSAIRDLRSAPDEAMKVLTRHETQYRREAAQFSERFMGPSGDRLFTCGAGVNICVDAYGRILPCMGLRDPTLTQESSRVDLAGAIERFRTLKGMRAQNPQYLERCAQCFLKGFCEQCPARSWSEHGTLDTPVEYMCEVAHVQARRLGWLEEGEQAWEPSVAERWNNRRPG